TADPPVLSALAPGTVTIYAGNATATVTVSAGPLPSGTVLWSYPGNGSGVTNIIPAVPSPTGVADVFALQSDGTVQAITSDGTLAWTTSVLPQAGFPYFLPTFQGGLVAMNVTANSIRIIDGITGLVSATYTPSSGSFLTGAAALQGSVPYV